MFAGWGGRLRRLSPLAPRLTHFWETQSPARRQWTGAVVGLGLLGLGLTAAAPARMGLNPDGVAAGFVSTSGLGGDVFLASGEGFALELAPNDMRLSLASLGEGGESHAIRLRLVGGDARAMLTGADPLPPLAPQHDGVLGTGRRPAYASVVYRDVYPGIDARFFGYRGELQYSFRVDRGASPRVIVLELEGVDRLDLLPDGSVVAASGGVRLTHAAPSARLLGGSSVEDVAISYTMRGPRHVGFDIASYDVRRPLVIRFGRGVVTDARPIQTASADTSTHRR